MVPNDDKESFTVEGRSSFRKGENRIMMNTTTAAGGEIAKTILDEFNEEKQRYRRQIEELKKWCEGELHEFENRSDEMFLEWFVEKANTPVPAISEKTILLKELIQNVSK